MAGQHTPTPGKTVYGRDGRSAEFVGMVGDRFLVRPIAQFTDWEGGDSFAITDDLVIWEQVYPKAPVDVVAAEIVAAKAHLAQLEADASAVTRRILDEAREAAAKRAELSKWDGLDTLEDFLAGRITHLVKVGYGAPSITTLAEELVDRDDNGRERGLKLLTLFGVTEGKLTWGINRYRDGSGTNTNIYPAKSHAEAVDICQRLFDEAMPTFRATEGYMHGFNYWIEAASRLGISLPDDLVERWRLHALEGAQASLAKAVADVEARAAAVEALRAPSSEGASS